MRKDLLYYGAVDGLSPGTCHLHSHPRDIIEDHQLTSMSFHWQPFAEEALAVAYSSPEKGPLVAILGAECSAHNLLPNASYHSFIPTQENPHAAQTSELDANPLSYSCVAAHCAGIIGASKNSAASGIAPDCELICLQAITAEGYTTVQSILSAVQYAVDRNVQILCIPLSFQFNSEDKIQQKLKEVLQKAAEGGMLIIASKNLKSSDGASNASYEYCFPADEPFVCSVVGFDTKYDLIKPLEEEEAADVAAPAVSVWSLHPAIIDEDENENENVDLFCRMSGNAMATCIVAGLAARITKRNSIDIPFHFKEFLRAGILNCSVHSHPLTISHILDPKSFPAVVKEAKNETSQKPNYFCSPYIDDIIPPEPSNVVEKKDKAPPASDKSSSDAILPVKEDSAQQKSLPVVIEEVVEEDTYLSYQKKVYNEIIDQGADSAKNDPFLVLRKKQHTLLKDKKKPRLQPYNIPQTVDEIAAESYAKKNGPLFGFIDWALGYLKPFEMILSSKVGLGKKIRGNISSREDSSHQVYETPEAIHLLISKRISVNDLNNYLWKALEACEGNGYEDWVITKDNYLAENLDSLLERTGHVGKESEIRSSKLLLKRNITIPCIWEFCNHLMKNEGVIDAEPLFLESEYRLELKVDTTHFVDSCTMKKTGAHNELAEYLGMEPDFDMTNVGDDIHIAVIDMNFHEHECLQRGNLQYADGWDYVRHKPFHSIDDLWSLNNLEYPPMTGSSGLANLSVLLGVEHVITGISPKSKITPFRAFYETTQSIEATPNRFGMIFKSSHKSTLRLTEAVIHATKINADIISIHFGVVTPSFAGYLRRIIATAERKNILIIATAGEYVRFNNTKSKYSQFCPSGGSVISPARFVETICVASCSFSNDIWPSSCYGPQVDVSSLVESVVIGANSKNELMEDSGTCGASSTSIGTPTVAALAALWISYHGKEKLLKIYKNVCTLNFVFKRVLKECVYCPKFWDEQKQKLFGTGTTFSIVHRLFDNPLPTHKIMREYVGTRLRTSPPIFGLDFATSDDVPLSLQREIMFLYYSNPYLRVLQRQQFYQELLGSLSAPGQHNLVDIIKKLPYIAFDTKVGISMASGDFLVTSTGHVLDTVKSMNLSKKVGSDNPAPIAHFAAPSGCWRSVFYVGKDYFIHQLFWYQSIRHWVTSLCHQNLTNEFGIGARAKRTSGPVAFRKEDIYYVYYVGRKNHIHLLRSAEQTKVWHHQKLVLLYKGFELHVHPESGNLLRFPETDASCLVFRILTPNGGWEVHHILAFPGAKHTTCSSSIPHHEVHFSPLT